MIGDHEDQAELELYRSLFDLAMLGTAHLSSDGAFLRVNSTFATGILGYDPAELAGRLVSDFTHPEDVGPLRTRFAELFTGGLVRSSADRRMRHKSGHYVWVNATARVMRDDKGEPLYLIALLQDISERKQRELEAKQKEQQLNLILDAIEDVVWSFSATEYRLEFMNTRATELLYGRSPRDFYHDPELWQKVVHPEDRELVLGIWDRLASVGFTEDHYRVVRPDGEVRWVQARAWTTRDAEGKPIRFEGALRDVTVSRMAELALRESETRLRLVMESGKMGVWEYEPATGKAVWSRVFREILGAPDSQPDSPDYLLSIVHPEDRERYIEASRDLVMGRSTFPPFRIQRGDGSIRWVQNIGKVIRLGSEPDGRLIGVLVDVTEARESERTIEAQREKMEASSKLSALGVMAGGMAHEINNPVAIIHGNATLLQQMASRGNLAPEQMEKTARVIAQTAERISKITRSLLAFARDSDGDPLKRVSIRTLIDETAEFCRERIRGHGIELIIDPIEPALELECRPVQISQVLLNLLNNAHDAVEFLQERWIRIAVAELENFLEIRVTDSGPGIARDLRDKIFQPFFTTKEVGKGTGLGLSVATGIVESHGGSLRLEEAHPYTRFVIRLPKAGPNGGRKHSR